MEHRFWLLLIQFFISISATVGTGCLRRYYPGPKQLVCACNSTFCDELPRIGKIPIDAAVLISSSQHGFRFEREDLSFSSKFLASKEKENITRILIDGRQRFQTIHGFGGAFTDSVGMNLETLSDSTQEQLINAYFGEKGLEYTLGRVPIGSTDFSKNEYSYDDVPEDFNLRHFALKNEDYKFKIKFIKMALQASPNKIRLIASPWSSPAWMKTNGKMSGGGALRDDFRVHRAYANYFVRFFEEYDKEGINFWGVTIENEPTAGAVPTYKWQSLFFTATTERDFVRDYLGPTMKSHVLTGNISIICLDDNRIWLPIWADIMFEDEKVEKYVDGIGIHWYGNGLYPAHLLTTTHQRHPTKFILATEACAGSSFPHGPILGDWYRAEQYAYDIITDLNNFVTGWMDWNLCLDLNGGPTWAKNFVDSPIIINSTANEFYKQPMFYAMGHFSKFLSPGSRRILSKVHTSNKHLQITAAVNKGQRVLVILNQSDEEEDIYVDDAMKRNVHLNLVVPAHSISTVIWNKK